MKIEMFTEFGNEVLQIIEDLEKQTFEEIFFSKEKLAHELSDRKNPMALIARDESGKPIGYKVGYEKHAGNFYSWIGGVVPEHRQKGAAKAMMKMQHEWAKEKGYIKVSTNTQNEFMPMLILNLKSGFKVIGTAVKSSNGVLKILLEKEL